MNRDPGRLSSREYDLVIVGGGIYGVCAAWDAALRGLSVALLDRGDFGHATSANCLKLVHGGFRYLQHADVRRIRESAHERRVFMRIAPHLVHPIPFLIPTYGHGKQGKELLAVGLLLYNSIVFDRNRGVRDDQKRIPFGRLISKNECQRLFPAIERQGLTGAVIFYDGQMPEPPRVLLSYLRSAIQRGAQAINYAEVIGFLEDDGRVKGVKAKDLLTGNEFEVRGRMVLNASGPWVQQLLEGLVDRHLRPPLRFSKDLYLVVNRRPTAKYALCVPSKHRDPNAIVSRGQRHLFVIPWRDHTLIGSSHVAWRGRADEFQVTEADIQELLDDINESYPAASFDRSDVSFFNAGLVPMDRGNNGSADVKLGRRHDIIDHEAQDGLAGLVSVIGIRYTTSRYVAQRTIDLVLRRLGQRPQHCLTATTPLYGGNIENFSYFVRGEANKIPHGLDADITHRLIGTYGSEYSEVLRLVDEDSCLKEMLGDSKVLKAEVVHGVRTEMAQKLGDVVFRRTCLGTAGNPGEVALRECATLMARELKWNETRVRKELDEVRNVFP